MIIELGLLSHVSQSSNVLDAVFVSVTMAPSGGDAGEKESEGDAFKFVDLRWQVEVSK